MNTKLQSVGVGIVMACAVFVVFFTQAPAGTWFNLRNAPGNYLQKFIAPGQPADLFGGKELDRNPANFVDIFTPVGACPV